MYKQSHQRGACSKELQVLVQTLHKLKVDMPSNFAVRSCKQVQTLHTLHMLQVDTPSNFNIIASTHCLMFPFLSQNLCIDLLSGVTRRRSWSKEARARSNAPNLEEEPGQRRQGGKVQCAQPYLHGFARHLSPRCKAAILSPQIRVTIANPAWL